MPHRRLRRTFRSILCPIDFSPSSRAALRYAAALARRSRGSLVVLFVNDPLLVAAAAAAYDARTLAASSVRELRRFVTKALGPEPDVPSITLDTVVGSPVAAILTRARERHCDMIVMGTHGRSGPSRWLFGSVTRAVLKRTILPVMAIPPVHRGTKAPATGAREWPGPLIIAPIDLNDHARADATRAAAVARGFGAKLVLFHALPGDLPTQSRDVPASFWQKKAKAQQRLDAIRRTIADVVEDCRVTAGTPARAVAALAAGGQYGMVVLTLRRSGLFGSPRGSITYQILGRSRTPVLALPPRSARSRLTGLSRKSLK
jgi:nucleotide-binding universal stress UspA family protein